MISRPVTSATSAVAVTDCPATPSLTPRLSAIGVNRLAGKNSAMIRPNTPSPSDQTARQAGTIGALASFALMDEFICYSPVINM
ncbi:hypothetical protein D3C75_1241480 [compost metagenome]